MNNHISLFIMFFLSISAFVSNYSTSEPNITESEYLSDFDELIDTLKSVHPALYEFTSKEEFDKITTRIRNEIDEKTTKRELLWKLNEVITLAGCSHSNFGFFQAYSHLLDFEEYFPLQARLIKGEYVVTDPQINNSIVNVGDIITSINGVSISEIIDEVFKHIHGQAHIRSSKKGMFNVFQDTYIPFALNFPKTFSVEIKGKKGAVNLKSISVKPNYPPMINPQSQCQETLCLNELSKNTALLTTRSFAYYGDRTPIFTSFIDSAFSEIKGKGYENLIIDIRGNLGGTAHATWHLLKHTLSNPFTYYSKSDFGNTAEKIPFDNNFKGKIVILINGDGFSSVGQLASIYKEKNRVIFVGETLGSNHFCTANQKQFQLTNTKFKYTVARNIFRTDVSVTDNFAKIRPDYYVEQNLEEYLGNDDVVLSTALDIIENK